jgi:hypothetical protein
MSEFKVGDRVRTRADKERGLLKGPYTGTVAKTSRTHVWVLRDDGVKGAMDDGSWNTTPAYLEHIEAAPAASGEKDTGHIAGLDPEAIDWDAHKDFGRSM